MKKIVWILFLLGSAVVCIAQPGYPVNLRNVIIGYQTTPEGLFFRGNHSPNHIPLEKYGTFMYVDTLTRQIWMYLDKDIVNGQPVGVWAKMYPSVSDLSSLTDVNTTGKIQNSMLIYDAVTSKWIIDNGTVYRKTTDALSGEVYGAYNDTKLDSVSALYFDLDTPPVTLGVGMLSWDNNTGTASLGLLGGNVQLKVGQQLVKRVVNKTTNNVNLLKSEYKVVKLLGASGSRISVDLAQANNEAGSAGTLGVVIEDINNNQEGFILVAGEITNINTTGNLVGEDWNEGDMLYLSATTPGALTKVKPAPPNHTVIVGWVESVNANNGKIYVKIDNGYELEELHNVLTTNKTNGSILYYDNDNGLWKASTGITLDNTGTLALNAVTANTLMYVDENKKLRSVTLTTTGSSGAATFSNGTLNIPQYAGSTDLTFSGDNSPVTLNSSTGTDVTFTAGTNIAFSQAGNNLTINSTVTSSNIYNSNGSIPINTTRTVTLDGNSPSGNTTLLEFKQNTGTGKTTFNGGSILIDKPSNTAPTDQSLEVNALSIEGRSVIGGVTEKSGIVLAEGAVELRSDAAPIGSPGSPALKVNANNTVSLSTLGTVTSGPGVRLLFREADGVLTDQLVINGSSYPALNRLLPSQSNNANKYLKTNGTDVSWADIVAGVSSVTATPPLFSSVGADPNITIQQATSTQDGFLSSTDWNTFNSKQAALSGTGLVRVAGTTITYDNITYVPASRSISTTSPLQGGGDLTGNRTLSILDAIADGTTKGASTYTANDFNSSSGLISIDYANGQSAGTGTKGFLTSTDWNTFNNKQAALTFTSPLTNTGNAITINQASTNTNGFLTSTDWNIFNNKQNALTNPVTGIGVANRVAFWSGAGTLSNNANLVWDNSNSKLGIGNAAPDSTLTVTGGIRATRDMYARRYNVSTITGQVLSINNYAPAGSPGKNIWIGNGGQSSAWTTGDEGSGNVSFGFDALLNNQKGSYNFALGQDALSSNLTGSNNVAIGRGAMGSSTTEQSSFALGAYALQFNSSTTGENIAMGYASMQNSVNGIYNVAIGSYTLLNNNGGYKNIVVGRASLLSNTTGYQNVVVGYFGLGNITTGYGNIGIGDEAGSYFGASTSNKNQISNKSIYIGRDTRASANGNTNEIVIGDEGRGNGSNTTTIGNSNTTKTVLPGGTLTLSGSPPTISDNNYDLIVRNNTSGLSLGDISTVSVLSASKGGTGLNSVTGYLKGTGAAYIPVNIIPVADGGTGLGEVNSNGSVLFNNNTTAGPYTRQTPSVYTTSNTGTSLTWDLVYRSSGVYRISHASSTTISSVTVSNVVAGGIYAFHISGASNTVTITVQWPTGTFKDLTASTNYGTRVYTTPTIITCYYDGTNFVCE